MNTTRLLCLLAAGTAFSGAALAQAAQPAAPADPAVPATVGTGADANTETTGVSAQGVGAQGGDPETLGASGEIIVTATRRAQNLQDIPIAISAVGGQALENNKITNVLQLQGSIPGLQVNRNNATVAFTLRGVGSNFRVQGVDTTVAAHTDGVYISSPNALTASFFDIDRVEVVKGPQGVLYGRNASGGAVNLISNLPTRDFGGYVLGGYGNFDYVELEGVVSGPLSDTVGLRVGGYYRNRGGFGRNTFLNKDEEDLNEGGGKATLQFKPSERLEIILRGDYYKADDHANGTNAYPGRTRPNTCLPAAPCGPGQTLAETRGGVIAPRPRDVNSNVRTQRELEVWGVSGEINFELSDRVTLKSLTGYRYIDSFQTFDQDTTRLPINDPFTQSVDGGQFSQELQASYSADGIYGIIGAYYFRERRDVFFLLASPALSFLPNPPNFRDVSQVGYTKTRAGAIFANADIDLTDQLTLGVGARYSSETRGTAGLNASIFGPAVIRDYFDRTFNAFTPRFTLDYQVNDDLTAYVNVSRGFKSGQFGVAVAAPALPEYLWDYEGGIKGRLFGNRLRYSIGGFYYDFKNVQLQLFRGPVNVITNAPGGKAYGLEASLDLDLPGDFRIHADGLLEDTEYQGLITDDPNFNILNVDLSGNRFPYAPKFSYNLSAEKDIDFGTTGRGTLRVEDQYNSTMFLDIYQNPINGRRPGYHILNASYRHELDNGLSILLWARNLTDKTVPLATNFGFGPFGNTRLVNFNPPRTYGATVKFEF